MVLGNFLTFVDDFSRKVWVFKVENQIEKKKKQIGKNLKVFKDRKWT